MSKHNNHPDFTRAEKDIFDACIRGLCNKDIANELEIVEKTVKFHLTNIYRKAKVRTRAELIVKYFTKGYVIDFI